MPNYNVDDILEEVRRKREFGHEPERRSPPEECPPRRRDYPDWDAPRYAPQPPREERGYDYSAPPPERSRWDAPRSAPPYDAPPRRREEDYDAYRREEYRRARYEPEPYAREEDYPPPRRDRYREDGYDAYRREEYEPPRTRRREYESYPEDYGYAPREERRPAGGYDYDRPLPSAPTVAETRTARVQTPVDPVPVPPPASPPPTVRRRTPKPSMDDLLQNFGEGVGLGKGLDPDQPLNTARRRTSVMSQTEPQPDMQSSAPLYSPVVSSAVGAQTGFPNAGGGVFSFHFSPPPASPSPDTPMQATGSFSYTPAYSSLSEEPFCRNSHSEPSYQPPASPVYTPPEPSYHPPASPVYTPPEPSYQPPASPVYTPPEPSYQPPASPGYTPPEPSYQPPASPVYTPPEPSYQAPASPVYTPPEPSYQAPASPVSPEPVVSAPEQPERPLKTASFIPDPVFAPSVPVEAPEIPEVPKESRLSFDSVSSAAAPVPPKPAVPSFTPPEEEFPGEPVQKEGSTRVSTRPESELLHRTPIGSAPIPLAPGDIQDDSIADSRYEDDEEERRSILGEIKHLRMSLGIRIGATSAAFLGLFYFGMAYLNPAVPTFPFMWAEGDTMRTFLIVNLLLMAGAMLVNSQTIGGGLVGLCTLRADGDSLIALSMLASVAQGVALVITPSAADFGNGVHLYFCIPVFGMLLNLLGRLMQAKRIEIGGRMACADGDKHVMRTVKSEDFSHELSRGIQSDPPEIAYAVKTRYVTGFLDASYAHDYAHGLTRILAFVALGASILVSFLTYYLFLDTTIYTTLSVCAALLAVCAPATTTIVSNLPMLRAAGRLKKCGAAIAGYPVVEEYNDVKAVTFRARELFPEDSISLSAMKVFQENQIESAILDAASLICATDSPLASIFKSMINSNDSVLKPVENVVYEDEMGLSAWVEGKRVLIGNAQLMRNHGVATPSRDYEQRVAGEGKEILYLANSGDLIALFALSYTPNHRVSAQMQELAAANMALIVHTTDPIITPAWLATMFHYPEKLIRIIPSALHADYDRMTAPRGRAQASILYSGTIMSMLRALGMIGRIKASVTVGVACQLMEILVGYAVITFFAFFVGMSYLAFYFILIYQLIWTLAVVLVGSLRRI